MSRPIVIIESPFAGDFELNREYLAECIHDSIKNGEAPYASHGFFTHFLDDDDPKERELGIALGFRFQEIADKIAVYCDLGVSSGMAAGIENAKKLSKPIVYRFIHD